MPIWNEILDSLQELWALIEEIQGDLANPATEEESRIDLQQLLDLCFATWDEIVAKYGRPQRS